jgi:hypothetical protein
MVISVRYGKEMVLKSHKNRQKKRDEISERWLSNGPEDKVPKATGDGYIRQRDKGRPTTC